MIIPEKVGSLFGVESSPAALMAARLAGLGSVAIALFAWLMRNVEDIKTQHALTLTLFMVNGIGILLSLKGIISGTMETGWPAVGYYKFVIGIASGYTKSEQHIVKCVNIKYLKN